MGVGGEAGRSALEVAAALRREAAECEARARRFEQGAFGEQLTGRILDGERRNGWKVFHDLAMPGRTANIDHIVVAPGGVFVIDSKHWALAANEGDGTLWTGRIPHRKELHDLTGIVARVRQALGPRRIVIRGVLSLTGAPPVSPLLRAGDIEAVSAHDLVAHLRSQPQTLGPADIEAVAPVLAWAFPLRSEPTDQPVPATPSWSPSPPTPPPAPSAVALRRPGARSGPPRPRRPVRRKRGPSVLGRVLIAAIVLMGTLVALGIITTYTRAMSHPTLSALPTTTTVPVEPLVVRWSCPAPTQGWTATIVWPAGVPAPDDWMIQTAPVAGGSWVLAASGFGSQPTQLKRVEPKETERVRAGSLITLEVSGQALTGGVLTAPAGC